MLEGNDTILKAGRILSWMHTDKAVDCSMLSQEHVERSVEGGGTLQKLYCWPTASSAPLNSKNMTMEHEV